MVKEFNLETQEEVTREMNDFEHEQFLIANAEEEEHAAKKAEEKALEDSKKAAKAELLATLNLSQETLDLLNGLN